LTMTGPAASRSFASDICAVASFHSFSMVLGRGGLTDLRTVNSTPAVAKMAATPPTTCNRCGIPARRGHGDQFVLERSTNVMLAIAGDDLLTHGLVGFH
jgi:hypothetical protein